MNPFEVTLFASKFAIKAYGRPMREILFDTETTGFDPFSGDRLIEIGCVNMINKIIQKGDEHVFHKYVNYLRSSAATAVRERRVKMIM